MEGRALCQIVRESSQELRQLRREVAVAKERKMPSLGRVTPVANVGDPPIGHRCEVDDEINTTVVRPVAGAPAEDHLSVLNGSTRLTRCEAERGQRRVKDGRNEIERRIERRIVWRERIRDERHGTHPRTASAKGADRNRRHVITTGVSPNAQILG
jgi:hypothetical protein